MGIYVRKWKTTDQAQKNVLKCARNCTHTRSLYASLHISRNRIDWIRALQRVLCRHACTSKSYEFYMVLLFSVSLFAHGACRVGLRIDAMKIGSILADHKMAKFSGINVKFIGNF